jgi:Peptidase family M28
LQRVPFVSYRRRGALRLTGQRGAATGFRWNEELVGRAYPDIKAWRADSAEVVFAGYGIAAPDLKRDDYKSADVRGKIVFVLAGAPANDSSLPLGSFGGLRLKGTAGAIRGATAVVFVYDQQAVGSPMTMLSTAWSAATQLDDPTYAADSGQPSPRVLLVVDKEAARRALITLGYDLDSLTRHAADTAFRPMRLDVRATGDITPNVERRFTSANVIARIDGSDPRLRTQYVLYSAHWDHIGRDSTLSGDQIFNGAADNAGGVAQMLEIARAFTRAPPKRTIVFIATTAEEMGLLGAQWYARHPIYPLSSTLAAINLDWFWQFGRTRDVVDVGAGLSTIDSVVAIAVREQGRVTVPDPWPEQAFFLRADHYAFAMVGVPALFAGSGTDVIGKPKEWGKRKFDEYMENDYHKVTDEPKRDWDYTGAVDDARLYFRVGQIIANGATFPRWKDNPKAAEFKAKRERSATRH